VVAEPVTPQPAAARVVGGTVFGPGAGAPPSTGMPSAGMPSAGVPTAQPTVSPTPPASATAAGPPPPVIIDIGLDDEVTLHDALPIDGEEMSARFGDRWVDGFEICEAVPYGTEYRYRLKRRVDGSVLPKLFTPDEIRPAAVVAQERLDDRRGVWSRLSK
jgi:hypothetical protein